MRRLGTCLRHLDQVAAGHLHGTHGKQPPLQGLLLLALNGADRAVRLDSHDVRYLQRRFKQRGPKLSGGGAGGRDGQVTQAVSVSSTTGEGVDGLVDAIMRLRDGRDVVICGLSGAGSSPLAQSLAAAISADTRVGGGGSGASSIGLIGPATNGHSSMPP